MFKEDIEGFRVLLNELSFSKLEDSLMGKPFSEMEDILYRLAYNPETDESNLLVYTFLQQTLYKKETSIIHLSISRLMGFILNHIDKAESIGLFHGLRAAELDPDNLDIKEYLIYYNHIPEKLLNDDDAIKLALEVIKLRPESKVAHITLSKTNFSH